VTFNLENGIRSVPDSIRRLLEIEQIQHPVLALVILHRHLQKNTIIAGGSFKPDFEKQVCKTANVCWIA